MRIAMVGGAGFLGCAIGQQLASAGHKVYAMDLVGRLRAQTHRLKNCISVPFDFANPTNPDRPLPTMDMLIHLGSTTDPAKSMQDVGYDADSNIGSSLRLFDAAARAGARRVIFASSGGAVYGAVNQLPVREDHLCAPLCAYGVSKRAIESYLAIDTRFDSVSLRVANPYGEQQLDGTTVGVIARFMSQLVKGEPLQVWGNGSVVRDYIAVEDVAAAFLAAVENRPLPEQVYNIGSGQGTDLRQVINTLFEVSDRSVAVEYREGRPYDVPAVVLDSTAFTTRTGWRPNVSLTEGITRLWQQTLKSTPSAQHR